MNEKFISIGKAAKLMNVTVKALRFYDKIGLLSPGYIDPETKYRYYGYDQLIRIDLIKAARNLEISPNALVPFFSERDTDKLVGLMRSHKDILEEKMQQLRKTIEQIETIERILKTAEHTDKSGDIYMRDIPDRYVITRPFDIEQTEEEMLMSFYQLVASINRMGLTYLYEDGLIYSLDKDTLCAKSIYACVLKDTSLSEYQLLPGGSYICTVFHKDNAEEQFNKLLEYALSHGLMPQFIYQSQLLTDFFADEPEYFEAQIHAEALS